MEELYVSFELTMPVRMSWNGQWAGDGWLNNENVKTRHFVVKTGVTRKERNKLMELLKWEKETSYFYTFNDGWQAEVKLEDITPSMAARRGRRSNFCGCEWMIDSLLLYGEIRSVRTAAELRHHLLPDLLTLKIKTDGKDKKPTSRSRC